RKAALAPLLVGSEDDLGVAARAEDPAFRLQLGAQLAKVVDLAVEHDPGLAIGAGHRLGRRFAEVANPQSPKRKSCTQHRRRLHLCGRIDANGRAAIVDGKKSFAVWPAMPNDRMHGEKAPGECRRARSREKYADAAHGIEPRASQASSGAP